LDFIFLTSLATTGLSRTLLHEVSSVTQKILALFEEQLQAFYGHFPLSTIIPQDLISALSSET
jgi:hypothetical protein